MVGTSSQTIKVKCKAELDKLDGYVTPVLILKTSAALRVSASRSLCWLFSNRLLFDATHQ